MKNAIILTLAVVLSGCKSQRLAPAIYTSDYLIIEPVTEKVFKHVSFLDIPDYGKFPCNGMVFINGGEAIVFDTPTTDPASAELIDWIARTREATIKAVVINHFHDDCLGGLEEFRKNGIPSYASKETIRLTRRHDAPLPDHGFDGKLELEAGDELTLTEFPGPGHTADNVVSYIPSERTLFGGCLIKETGAGKGNLADADVREWPTTVGKVREKYPRVRYVIPGHGKAGGPELFDYTIKLFE